MTRAELNSWRTAIKRGCVSAPAQWLWEHGFIPPLVNNRRDVLDYGSGRGDDAVALQCDAYDPHFAPIMPRGLFDVVLCTYVLNTLPKSREAEVLAGVVAKLRQPGRTYITVRRNVRRLGYTSRGTYQRNVVLPYSVIHETGDYCIYRLYA